MDIDDSVVMGGAGEDIREINDNGNNTIKNRI